MNRKLQRIILDLEDLSDERYIDDESKKAIDKAIRELKDLHVYSMEV